MTNFNVNLDSCVRKNINLGKICAKFQSGEHCPECAESEKLFKLGKQNNDERLIEDAKTLYARSRVFVNAINVHDEDKTHPVYIYIFPPKVYDDLMSMMRSQRHLDPKFNAFHPTHGRNIVITRKGTGKLTSYNAMIDSNVTPLINTELHDQLINGDFSAIHDLSKVEQYITSGYTHMRQFEVGPNVIRLLPPPDGQTVYKELKFHRFSIAELEAYKENSYSSRQAGVTATQSSTKNALPPPTQERKGYGTHPSNEAEATTPEFDPFDLPYDAARDPDMEVVGGTSPTNTPQNNMDDTVMEQLNDLLSPSK